MGVPIWDEIIEQLQEILHVNFYVIFRHQIRGDPNSKLLIYIYIYIYIVKKLTMLLYQYPVFYKSTRKEDTGITVCEC